MYSQIERVCEHTIGLVGEVRCNSAGAKCEAVNVPFGLEVDNGAGAREMVLANGCFQRSLYYEGIVLGGLKKHSNDFCVSFF